MNIQKDSTSFNTSTLQLSQSFFTQLGLYIDGPFTGFFTLSHLGFFKTLHPMEDAK